MLPSDLTQFVKQAAADAGFELAGIAPVSDFPELQYFVPWINAGSAGEMRYLESREPGGELKRATPTREFPWARSAIVCGLNYYTDPPAGNGKRETGNALGWISRYAWSQRDYHDVVLARLRQVEARLREASAETIQTRCYVDTGPLVERVFARHAGIGWTGKNTCLINQRLGSWLFLGVILTSITATAEAVSGRVSSPGMPAPDRCGTCRRCLDACPTNAFPAPYQLDASRCISYLTIEKRGEIPEALRAGMGRHVFGCDICQDVCPWNRKAPVSAMPDFQPRPGLVNPSLEWLTTIGEEDFRQTFRGSPVKRAKRQGLRRNAVIAMGNSGNKKFLPLLRELAEDSDEIVAKHAAWALEKLSSE